MRMARRVMERIMPPIVAAICFSVIGLLIAWLEPQLRWILRYCWAFAMCAFGFVAVVGVLMDALTSSNSKDPH